MTISEIKYKTIETYPYFFDRKTLKFFGQTMNGFKVKKQNDGRYRISQKMRDHSGKIVGETVRYFNPQNNKLEND